MPTHHYADVNGQRLHYASEGTGPLVMFVHGFPEFWYAWQGQLAEFGRDHHAVAPDMRGYNLSSKPKDVKDYAVPLLVEDLAALADHLGARKFTLVAHDWGGAVAWAFALMKPERLERLVIVNAPHPAIFQRLLAENANQQKASQYMLTFRSPEAEAMLSHDNFAVLRQMVLGEGQPGGWATPADTKAYLEAWGQPGALTGGLNFYRAARVGPPAPGEAPRGISPDLAAMTVKVPTLVIWGEKDRALLTDNLDGLEKVVLDLTVRRIPDGTHWVTHEKPAEVNGHIREFLEARRA
ncbi:MAG TPA: alpha/beta hydrolase [Verrucomicrobiae bacterium]|jgi:epoxide hydrolase 4|nr:alpha/beta hydrolase [Verrucomicrobiae bacterium]